MKTLVASAGVLGLALFGCSSSGFEDGGGDNLDEGSAVESGDYFAMVIPTSDTCGFTKGEPLEILPTEVKVSKDGKTLSFTHDEDPVSCTLEGKGSYRCALEIPPIEDADVDLEQAFDAEILLKQVGPGILDGTIKVTVTCPDGKCGDDPELPLPCEVNGKYALTRAMPADFAPEEGGYDVTVGMPLITTCDVAPPIAAKQKALIDPVDEDTANVFADNDPVPHECEFESRGHVFCSRTTETETTESFAQIDAVWTGARTFQGVAGVEINCREGKDCAGSELGELPCSALYFIEGAGVAGK